MFKNLKKLTRIGCRAALLGGASLLAMPVMSAYAQTENKDATAKDKDVVLVVGQRLSNANSINQQKNSANIVNVISADDLGKLPDANVADALARVPGVTVVVNQETGEGEYVSIRGFGSTYNAYAINGVRVALTDTDSRKMSMTVLPPNGLKSIVVSKTLTPDMDGDAIGGTVNFVTPNAFDFKKDVFRAFGSVGYNDRAEAQGEKSTSSQIQLDASHLFDNGKWGVFGSVNYGKSYYHNEETENDGEWEPYHFRLNSTEAIDSRSMYLPGIDLDYRRGEQERYGGNFSIDYHDDNNKLYFRGQYAKLNRTGTNDYTDERSRKTNRLQQLNIDDTSLLQPEQMITGHDARGNIYGYNTSQIRDSDGDGTITDRDTQTWYRIHNPDNTYSYTQSKPTGGVYDTYGSQSSYWSLYGRSGVWNPKAFQFARSFETQDQESDLATFNTGGTSQYGDWTFDYDLSYSYGKKGDPGHYSIGFNCDKCKTDPMFTSTGILWSSYDPRFPLAQLPAYAQNVDHRDDLLPFDGAGFERSEQTDKRTALKFDAKYKMNNFIDYVKLGFKYYKSERDYDRTPIWDGTVDGTPLDGSTLASSGLVERQVTGIDHNTYYYGSILDRNRVIAAINAAMAVNPTTYSYADLNSDDKKGSEAVMALYGLANMHFDDLTVISGLRVERTDVKNTAWVDDGNNSGFGTTKKDYTVALPSVTAIWRLGPKVVYRGALWTSFSRPEYTNILRGESVGRNAAHEIVSISRGNPDLKPAYSTNIDLSAEYYPDRMSVVSATLFHKNIDHFIFTNGQAVDAPTQDGTITITQPQNGKTADITGLELNLIKSFDGMIAPFDGFGVEVNATFQTSEADTGKAYRAGKKTPFIQCPDRQYNVALTYQKYGIEGKLAYQYSGEYIEDFRDNSVDKWVQPNKSLDLHLRYHVSEQMTVDLDAQNILDGHRYYTTKGKSPSYQKDYMEPGRNFVLRFAYSH